MKKIAIITIVCIVVLLAIFSVLSYMQVQEDRYIENLKNNIDELINNGDFTEIFRLYNGEEDKYKVRIIIAIEEYAAIICCDALLELDREKLLDLKEAGYDSELVNNTISEIENMLKKLQLSSESYENGIIAYNTKDYDKAKKEFQAIIPEHEKYIIVQGYIAEITTIQANWNITECGRSPYLSGQAYDGEYLYVPFCLNGVDGIYKISDDGTDTQFIPMNKDNLRLAIYGINIVGDYLYFIAGEKLGTGYIFDSPYNIYKMNKDGTDITMEIEGNFTDLFIKGSRAFAISREYGLIEFDKYFSNSTVITSEDVVELSWSDNDLYYTVREGLEFDSSNTVYLYNGQNSTGIYSDEQMHYYNFGDKYLKWWASTDSRETLYLGNDSEEVRITQKDINVVYGIVGNTVLYSTYGKWQQEYAYYYNIDTAEILVKNSYDDLLEYKTVGIFYEEEKLIIEMDGRLYFSNVSGDSITQIAVPDISDNLLNDNMNQIKHIDDGDLYLNEGDDPIIGVISDKQYWHYMDANINLYIEKRYMDEYDTNVYVTHIFINDYTMFKTGNGSGYDNARKTFRASDISDKYQIIYGQNGDTFLDRRNINRGIIIRNGRVLRKALLYDMLAFFEDGSMEIYRGTDDITGKELIDAGAMMSFSFGPVLVEDYKVLPDCAFDVLALRNPRSAIGYVEPGHYVSIVCDGRDEKVSRGLSMIQLAMVFEEEGCRLAYNLDGGTTSTITFFGNYITRRTAYPDVPEIYNHRKVAELFYIGTSEISPLDLSEYTYEYIYFAKNIK